MIRPQFHEVLGHVVHARIALDGLQEAVVNEMTRGFRPTYRGHSWSQDHFAVIDELAVVMDVAFDLCKWIQFPEVDFRKDDALFRVLGAIAPKEIAWKGSSLSQP